MDELDLLKKDWKKNNNQFPKVSEQDIYAMLHKKSSSIVKWIFIISVIEILIWSAISFFTADENYKKTLETYHIETVMNIFTIVNYCVILVFIYLFYRNFKRINTTDNAKLLMKSILTTRKTVQYYIWYNLVMMGITFVVAVTASFKYDSRVNQILTELSGEKSILFWIILLGITLTFLATFLIAFWLFYRLLYGFLLKRLQNNYEELKKIDL